MRNPESVRGMTLTIRRLTVERGRPLSDAIEIASFRAPDSRWSSVSALRANNPKGLAILESEHIPNGVRTRRYLGDGFDIIQEETLS